ncbi:MAG: biopolymer transporter ExbD [Planctomycetes bacterium]|nr:biopolymer transporter ExbD [Planctomycetota bacterium]
MPMVQSKTRAQPEIPTASMADIAFLLIIFFLVTTNFVKEKGLLMDLPNTDKEQQAPESKKKNLELFVGSKRILINGQEITMEDLLQRLNRELDGAASDSDRVVILKCDNDTPYERFVRAEDILQKTGEPFTDKNGNGLLDAGETYTDVNKNGRFDPGAIPTIEVEDSKEGGGKTVKEEDIKKVDMRGEIEKKMSDEEEEDSDEPPEGLTDAPAAPK